MIGIIGGYGEVGVQAALRLAEWGRLPLRIGGRNAAAVQAGRSGRLSAAEWQTVDIADERSLNSFADGCALLVNCAGPSFELSARLAGFCSRNGYLLVDAGLAQGAEAAGSGQEARGKGGSWPKESFLYAAGAMPGLSGLLPRWLARSMDTVRTLRCITGGLDTFTAAAAEDYLVGVMGAENEPLAAWKDGARRSAALSKQNAVRLPLYAREVTLYPYMDREAELVAGSLKLHDGEWYLAVDGTSVPAVLETARPQFAADRSGAIERLRRASGLDAAGRRSYIHFLIQAEGLRGGRPAARTLALRAESPSQLTGAAVAAAAMAAVEGGLPPQATPLAEIPDPDTIVSLLRRQSGLELQVLEGTIEDLLREEEGEL